MESSHELMSPKGGEADRVRANTSAEVNARLDREMREMPPKADASQNLLRKLQAAYKIGLNFYG